MATSRITFQRITSSRHDMNGTRATMGEFSNPDAYELWMGRWSSRLAPALVKFAGLPEGGRCLDVGSGTGALSAALLTAVIETTATDAAREAARRCLVVSYPDEGALRRLWQETGFIEVKTQGLEVAMEFASFEDYWSPFLSGVTPTSSYAGRLSEDERKAVKSRLRRKTIGPGPDRPFSLPAQAWAVRGRVSPVQ